MTELGLERRNVRISKGEIQCTYNTPIPFTSYVMINSCHFRFIFLINVLAQFSSEICKLTWK